MGQDARALWTVQGTESHQVWRPYLRLRVALGCRAGNASGRERFMYRVLAYGFVGFTAFLVLVLLVFWFQENRAAARRRRLARTKA
jgi:hypothetical protein